MKDLWNFNQLTTMQQRHFQGVLKLLISKCVHENPSNQIRIMSCEITQRQSH